MIQSHTERALMDPAITIKTIEGIRKYLIDHGIKKMGDLVESFRMS